ncbi:MAG TPA: metallophosphoesterase [Candidatus Paceibacterota bacterium]
MARTFFTSDHHFGHANILVYEAEKRRNERGLQFNSVAEMDDYLLDQWNTVVEPADTVYCLGDFCNNYQQMCDVLPFLNGRKILISGNHDSFFKMLIDSDPKRRLKAVELAVQAGFDSVHLQLDLVLDGVGQVRLAHFPYAPRNQTGLPDYELRYLENRPARGREKLLLHGHVHSQWLRHVYAGLPPMMNVGVDMWEMRPASAQQIVELFNAN